MATIANYLTSVIPNRRSAARRLVAITLCVMLILGSLLPPVALAAEADSEGEGTAPPVEAPIAPELEPSGEETALEEVAGSGEAEETEAVEVEPEVDPEAPAPSVATDVAGEEPPTEPVQVPPAATPPAEAPPVEEAEAEPATSEPVTNQPLSAPKPKPAKRSAERGRAARSEALPPAEPASSPPAEPPEEEAPSSPPYKPVAASADSKQRLADRKFYVVQPGDCLSIIAAALLPAGASSGDIAREVERLWRINETRIGTGDPDLIYAGTVLRVR